MGRSSSHINYEDLEKIKIPALSGRGSDNNRLLLEYVALKGPQLKYRIFKDLEARGLNRYSTVSRRVDVLTKTGYLAEALEIPTQRGKQTIEAGYGLTWKGFVASISIREVRQNILQVLKKNPLLDFLEKDIVLVVLEEIFTKEEIEVIATSAFHGFLKTSAPSIEVIKEEELKFWAIPSMREAPRIQVETRKAKDLTKLLDNPKILQYVKERIVPMIADYERQIRDLYSLISIANDIGKFITHLEVDNKPSEKLKEYLENKLPEVFSDAEKDSPGVKE